MTHSEKGRDLVATFEGCRLEAYQDGNGIWTIGHGHTGSDVRPGMICTQEQADAWLDEDLAEADSAIERLVHMPLNQNQYDALVSLVYNIGSGNFARSSCLRELNKGLYAAACLAIGLWNKIAGTVSPGLTRRREAEQVLFEEAA